MAEALGICSSIIAILELTQKAVEYFRDVKDATDDRWKLLSEVLGVKNLLVLLKDKLENQHPDTWSGSVQMLLGPEGPLTRMQKLLQKILAKLDPVEGWRRHTKALKWPFQKDEIMGHLATIERCKTLISLALNSDHMNLSQQIRTDVGALREEIQKIHEKQKENDLQSKIKADLEILEWLSPAAVTFWAKQKDTYEKRQEGTGQWFLESEPFTKWRDGLLDNGRRILLCYGMAGAGKSVLASLAIHQLEEMITRDQNSARLGYVYCDYKIQNQTAGTLSGALLRQFVSQLHSIPDGILALHSRYKPKGVRPSFKDISKQLREVIPLFKKVFLVIDALDECHEKERDSLVELVRSLGPRVHIMITSRQVRSIEELFEGEEHQEIQATDDDVKTYVRAQIQASRSLRSVLRDSRAARKTPGGAASLLEDIISTITAKAQGMFLLAQLHVNTVSWRATLKGVRQALKELPDELSLSYDITMERIENYPDKEGRRLAVLALTWIMHSIGPLKLAELQHALATGGGDTELNEDGIPGESIVITLCAGLVSLENTSQQIRLVHYTAQEYFERNASKLLPSPHSLLATACLTYLSFETFGIGRCQDLELLQEYKEDFGLLRYAAANWFIHVRVSEGFSDVEDAELTNLVISLLSKPENLTFALQVAGEFQAAEVRPGSLATAIFLGLGGAVKALLADENLNIRAQTFINQYSPLHLAISKGSEGSDYRMPLLLPRGKSRTDKDPNVYKKQDCASSSMSPAEIEANRTELVCLLLGNSDLDPNVRDIDGITPLCAAISMGHMQIVKLLLDDPRVNPNLLDNCDTHILAYTAGSGKG